MKKNLLNEINSQRYPEEEYFTVVRALEDGEKIPPKLQEKYKYFELGDGVLVRDGKLLITSEAVPKVIEGYYNKTFFGMNKLYQYLRDRYFGISQATVFDFVRNNKISQVHRLPQNVPSLKNTKPRPMPKKPMTWLQVDLSFYRDKVLLVVIDILSKYLWVKILNNKEASTVTRAMRTYLGSHPKPSVVQTDNGSEFQDEFNLLMKTYKIKHIKSKPFSPTSQGIVERVNGPIKNATEKFVTSKGGNPSGWQKFMIEWVGTYNNSEHSATRFKPNKLREGTDEEVNIALGNIEKQAEPMIEERQELAEKIKFPEVGNHVRIKLAKKSKLSKASVPQFSSGVYPVTHILKSKKDNIPSYLIRGRIYQADELLIVDPEKIIDTVKGDRETRVTPLPGASINERGGVSTRSSTRTKSGRVSKAPARLGFK